MRWPILLSLFLVACEPAAPPPGETIGSFTFVATLEDSESCVLGEVEEVPERLAFSGILSHEPSTGKVWLRAGSFQGEGRLEENRFTLRSPPMPPGVPREFAACTDGRRLPCGLRFTERIDGEILQGCEEGGQPDPLPCPETLEDGSVRWHHCTCIVGTFVEEVAFEGEEGEECTCRGKTRTDALESGCRLTYRLEGRKP